MMDSGRTQSRGTNMRLLTKSYPKWRIKCNGRDLIDLAIGYKRLRLRNVLRDRKVMRMRAKGVSVEAIEKLFSISNRTVTRINVRFKANEAEYKEFIAAELAKEPVRKPQIASKYYFNSCNKCLTGTMFGQMKPDTNSYELDCLSCGYTVSPAPLKRTRVENWDYETATRRFYNVAGSMP